ncbi:MAG: D-glycero-beta-D-manno-heptose 1,7-bisphosphate 7-phosphatase [Nitrosopumilaceae archaeon]
MPSAIFLDRDGVINQERKNYVKNLDEFLILDGVADAIKILKQNNFLVIVITNQSVINRNLLSIEMLDKIHAHLQNYLKKNGTYIDAIYYCPHLPEDNCSCRKPKPGLLLQAVRDFQINLEKSWMIGNSITDIDTAKVVGCNWILLEKGQNLLQAVKKLVSDHWT